MSSRIADIPVPPRCRQMIRAGALVAINTSAGKDSQAMTILLSRIVPAGQLVAVHAPLAEVEWEGVVAHIEATLPAGVPLVMAPVSSGKSLLERVEERGLWPSSKARWCTSDFKSGPIQRELRRYLKDRPRFGGQLVNAMGMRAEESPARARKMPWKRNDRMSVAGREVFDWLPVFDLSTEDVFRVIRNAGQSPHWAYAAGMSRLSCSFCILASRADLRRAAELRPELYRRYAELEQRIGHTLSPSAVPLPELTGISPSGADNGEDAMGLGSPRSQPAPARQTLARRSGVKPRCSRSGAGRGFG
ncbi:MAG: phosphoadenosine phosphosulfate reductase family protein [Bryobacterales bacterium]|nr:phosphoadenosine phosphosulfate reductase family protein [Bryobacterales bacterium]